MPNRIPQLSFADLILRFRSDATLAHDFVKGDATLDIIGEDGTYPSLAKLAASVQLLLAQQSRLGFVVKTYTFTPALFWNVKHPEVPSSNFVESIVNLNGDKVFAPRTVISDTEFTIHFTEPEGGILDVIYHI
jgi:hypothetical protein